MKQRYTFFILMLFGLSLNLQAQAEITYDLQCSGDNSKYELYVTRNTTPAGPYTNLGSSRVTLVFPTGSRSVSITNEGAVNSYSALPAIINPNGIGSDFYGFSTTGSASLIGTLPANAPTLWLTFTPSDGTSQNTRLFVNGSDPDSSAPGMGGVDLSNTFTVLAAPSATFVDEYNGNVSGIVNCGALDVNDFAFNNLSLYPNPTKNKLFIKGDIAYIKNIEILSVTGQLINRLSNNFNEIDVSALDGAMYFVKLYSETGTKIIKFVKE